MPMKLASAYLKFKSRGTVARMLDKYTLVAPKWIYMIFYLGINLFLKVFINGQILPNHLFDFLTEYDKIYCIALY